MNLLEPNDEGQQPWSTMICSLRDNLADQRIDIDVVVVLVYSEPLIKDTLKERKYE